MSYYDSIEEKFVLPDLEIDNDSNPQTIIDYIMELIKISYEGEVCPLVVSAIEHLYYEGERIVVPHKVNESGASSKEVGDIDIFDSAEQLVSSIEVKDKDFTKEDVEHAIKKFGSASLEKSMFIYGKNVHFEKDEVYQTAAKLGKKRYFCSVISIDNYIRMRLYSINQKVSLQQFINLLLEYSRRINTKDETIMWIKSCAAEFAL